MHIHLQLYPGIIACTNAISGVFFCERPHPHGHELIELEQSGQ